MVNKSKSNTKTAMITGATVGIGYELSKLFAKDNYNLLLVARNNKKLVERKEELEEKYAIKVNAIPKDLSKPEAPEEIYALLKKAGIYVDVLVNNAGFGAIGKFEDLSLQKQLDMIRLNIVAQTMLTKLFLPNMRRREGGKILNVASTAAYQPGPLMAVYYATKAYILSFSEALANECKGSNISVSALCPGPTQTEFQKRAGFGDIHLKKMQAMRPDVVASIAYREFQKGKAVIVPGLVNKLLIQMLRLAPRNVVKNMIRSLQESRS